MPSDCPAVEELPTAAASPRPHSNTIAVVGPPNVGKSVLFNSLTKTYSVVANYSQTTTVSIKKEAMFNGVRSRIVDTPGIASLSTSSEDEKETRNLLIHERPDLVIFCADATALKRSLVLFAQIQELGLPTVFCLNKVDDASKKGVVIDAAAMSAGVSAPVVETSAVHGRGIDRIGQAAKSASIARGLVKYPRVVEELIANLLDLFPVERQPPKGALLLLAQGDNDIRESISQEYGAQLLADADAVLRRAHLKTSRDNLKGAIFGAREAWADRLAEDVSTTSSLKFTGFSYRAAWLSRHPVYGWPVLMGILWIVFTGVGTIANEIAGYVDTWFAAPITDAIGALVTVPLVNEFLVGDFGVITMGVMNAIVTVIPILMVFFLITSFLEDVGYLPNLSVLANRMFRLLGLSGKSVLPYTLGFGCNTMATITTRMLETKKERIIICALIALGVPCSVQLGVMLAIMATAPFSALLIVITSVVGTMVVCGMLMNRLVPTTKTSDLILELPSLTLPNWENIVRKTYMRIKDFLNEVLPMFVAAAVLMFTLDKTGLLDGLKTVFRPILTGMLSLPDKVTEVFIMVVARREVGAVYFKDMYEASEVDYYQTVVGLVVMTLFIPCISNTMVMVKELGIRWATAINLGIIVIAFSVGALVNVLIRLF